MLAPFALLFMTVDSFKRQSDQKFICQLGRPERKEIALQRVPVMWQLVHWGGGARQSEFLGFPPCHQQPMPVQREGGLLEGPDRMSESELTNWWPIQHPTSNKQTKSSFCQNFTSWEMSLLLEIPDWKIRTHGACFLHFLYHQPSCFLSITCRARGGR